MINIKFLEFHIPFIYDNISKHNISCLALFNKGLIALRTSDFYSAFSPRYSYLLSTGRAFIDMMRFPLPHIALPCGKFLPETIFVFQIYGIFGTSLIQVLRKNSKIGINKKGDPNQIKRTSPKNGKKQADQHKNHQKTV